MSWAVLHLTLLLWFDSPFCEQVALQAFHVSTTETDVVVQTQAITAVRRRAVALRVSQGCTQRAHVAAAPTQRTFQIRQRAVVPRVFQGCTQQVHVAVAPTQRTFQRHTAVGARAVSRAW